MKYTLTCENVKQTYKTLPDLMRGLKGLGFPICDAIDVYQDVRATGKSILIRYNRVIEVETHE